MLNVDHHPRSPPSLARSNGATFAPVCGSTLFELVVVNNWQVIMGEIATVNGDVSRIYFLSWWVLSVLVMSNLLVAFILEEMSVGVDDSSADETLDSITIPPSESQGEHTDGPECATRRSNPSSEQGSESRAGLQPLVCCRTVAAVASAPPPGSAS